MSIATTPPVVMRVSLTSNPTLESKPIVNIAIWVTVGLIAFSAMILIVQSAVAFTKLRLVCVISGLLTLASACTTALHEYHLVDLLVMKNFFVFGSIFYIDLLVTIFLQLGLTLRLGRRKHKGSGFWFVIACASVFSISAVVYLLYFEIHGITIASPVFYNVMFLLCLMVAVMAMFGAVIYTFLPLILNIRTRDFGPKFDVFAVGIWYFCTVFIMILILIIYYIIALAYNSAFYPICTCIDLTIRMVILLFYAVPPPQFVIRFMRSKLQSRYSDGKQPNSNQVGPQEPEREQELDRDHGVVAYSSTQDLEMWAQKETLPADASKVEKYEYEYF